MKKVIAAISCSTLFSISYADTICEAFTITQYNLLNIQTATVSNEKNLNFTKSNPNFFIDQTIFPDFLPTCTSDSCGYTFELKNDGNDDYIVGIPFTGQEAFRVTLKNIHNSTFSLEHYKFPDSSSEFNYSFICTLSQSQK